MKIMAHSEVPKDISYFHIGYVSAAFWRQDGVVFMNIIISIIGVIWLTYIGKTIKKYFFNSKKEDKQTITDNNAQDESEIVKK